MKKKLLLAVTVVVVVIIFSTRLKVLGNMSDDVREVKTSSSDFSFTGSGGDRIKISLRTTGRKVESIKDHCRQGAEKAGAEGVLNPDILSRARNRVRKKNRRIGNQDAGLSFQKAFPAFQNRT